MPKIAVMLTATILAAGLSAATAAEPIVGSWRTASGETAKISPCGKAYCTTIVTGQHKGKRIGQMGGSGASYAGQITDPANGKTYEGTASVSGKSMKLTGCALKIFCKSQTWTRQ